VKLVRPDAYSTTNACPRSCGCRTNAPAGSALKSVASNLFVITATQSRTAVMRMLRNDRSHHDFAAVRGVISETSSRRMSLGAQHLCR
jgi:hypothetical protein